MNEIVVKKNTKIEASLKPSWDAGHNRLRRPESENSLTNKNVTGKFYAKHAMTGAPQHGHQ